MIPGSAGAVSSPAPRRIWGGLIVRRECWRVSWSGRLLLLGLGLVLTVVGMKTIHPFLATTQRSGASWLVVEGWIASYTMRQVAAEIKQGRYEQVLVVRAIDEGLGDRYESGQYLGEYMAGLLVQHGVPAERVHSVFFPVARKDRTYHSALAAQQWLAQHGIKVNAIDVATLGPHARRSRLLYEKAFGNSARIGVLSLEVRGYEPAHWWRSSEGVREVLGELLAYNYARIWFRPPSVGQAG